LYKRALSSFFLLHFGIVIFWQKDISKKAQKNVDELTPGKLSIKINLKARRLKLEMFKKSKKEHFIQNSCLKCISQVGILI
jgi:hypothetical protein